MLDARMAGAINDQINYEYFSAFIYLSMSARFAALGLPGGANWMNVQFQEELSHAMKLFTYMNERGGGVQLKAIAAPPVDWPDALTMFENALEHENKVTARINDLTDLALELRDHATHNTLQWFIAEQVEEEANAEEMIQKLRLTKDAPGGMFQLDNEMAARVYVPPVATA
jgi:ferritin